MNRSLRYVLLALLWSAVAGYLCFAGAVAVRGRAKRTVSRVEIEVVDSTSRGCLVSTMRAREWIGRSGIPTIGTAVDAVDLRGIERLIARNGFVKEAIASVDYSGTLRVSISQREPLLRLLTDGTNSYVTADGYVFAAPKASSLYVPVVTGDYRLPFPKDYVGSVHAYMQAELAKSEARIAALEKEKYPFFRQEIEIERRMKEVRRRRIRQGFSSGRPTSSAGSPNSGRRRPSCAASSATKPPRCRNASTGWAAGRRRSANGKKNWSKTTKISRNSLPLWKVSAAMRSGGRKSCR